MLKVDITELRGSVTEASLEYFVASLWFYFNLECYTTVTGCMSYKSTITISLVMFC